MKDVDFLRERDLLDGFGFDSEGQSKSTVFISLSKLREIVDFLKEKSDDLVLVCHQHFNSNDDSCKANLLFSILDSYDDFEFLIYSLYRCSKEGKEE